jgi:uridine monophosphate synthetase
MSSSEKSHGIEANKDWAQEKKQMGAEIMEALWKHGCFKLGDFTLVSGRKSPYYINLREVGSYDDGGELLRRIGYSMGRMITNEFEGVNKVVGVAYAGIPFATAVTMATGIPCCHTRKEPKTHGMVGTFVDGSFSDGDRVVILDDLVTTGDSKLEGRDCIVNQEKVLNQERQKQRLPRIRINVVGVACVFDREEGGAEFLKANGLPLASLIRVREGVDQLWNKGLATDEQWRKITDHVVHYQNDSGKRA